MKLAAEASAFLEKPPSAPRWRSRRAKNLDGRQRAIAKLIGKGWTNEQIAAAYDITRRRVRQILVQMALILRLDMGRDLRTQIACAAGCAGIATP